MVQRPALGGEAFQRIGGEAFQKGDSAANAPGVSGIVPLFGAFCALLPMSSGM
jgi:hypothetical protein